MWSKLRGWWDYLWIKVVRFPVETATSRMQIRVRPWQRDSVCKCNRNCRYSDSTQHNNISLWDILHSTILRDHLRKWRHSLWKIAMKYIYIYLIYICTISRDISYWMTLEKVSCEVISKLQALIEIIYIYTVVHMKLCLKHQGFASIFQQNYIISRRCGRIIDTNDEISFA